MRALRWLLGLLAGCVMLPGFAHHGISNWDLNKDVTVEGRITRVDFISPHAWLHLTVRRADGKSEEWSCEMLSLIHI